MVISYPTGLDNFSNPGSGAGLNIPSHTTQHVNLKTGGDGAVGTSSTYQNTSIF